MKAQIALMLGTRQLEGAGIRGAATDARRLLAHVMEVPPERLYLSIHSELSEDRHKQFLKCLAAREARQPVAQITGHRAFWKHEFRVTRATLDPRPETELLVEVALETGFERVLDLGTGTGCILLSLLSERPAAEGVATDISEAALAVAQENAERLSLHERARFVQGDWFHGVEGRFDLIVSNPPYITEAEMAELAPDVRDWEPRAALTPGGDGLGAYRTIAFGAFARLRPGGRIALEIGPTQAAAVSAMLAAQGFAAVEVRQDLGRRDRVVLAHRP
ncbi:peptide chain release factor N(5)-glutamine methyltransferase [Rhodobacter capsulatus]|uniref:Release factor glutamine methyltransferase n=1 Tax=Rhodobacter capsulatus TaxID=1061 RepID=A0A0N8VG54_RHOCA|nr:peptide chain release factor N(5)-glutamine methyltransferase [Rhodobacter capsulatus]KQB16533.1 protein-(glutamine-N5) methyltransferase, release factor-specific [Rhodobacter capsulatus]KQB17043.1 protein-(glutamine-N5) methyltransferase, release factor-specific [Rhodobacter capsulatus]PZX21856.1 release factor glutamine methyltransferase [Rhodobacter capsulatus]QNR62505.1 peptide chain release factor N(5)-glutamine methyltransferase [Rhodobacter capsulatus]WER08546.1 peptide chain release